MYSFIFFVTTLASSSDSPQKNEYTSWINSENDVEVRKTEKVINKATKKEDNTSVGSLFDSLEKQATESGL